MVKGIIFMGTPHRGAGTAWVTFLARTLEAPSMGLTTIQNLVANLGKNSQALRQISQQFIERTPTLKIIAFYEMGSLDYTNCPVCFSG